MKDLLKNFREPGFKKDVFYLTQYNDTYFRITYCKSVKNKNVDFPLNSDKIKVLCNVEDKQEVERISLSRSRRRIREICFCNPFEYFVTLTVDSKNCDRFSLTDCQDRLRKICKKIKRGNKNFIYIFITERHKNGAFHFHGLVGGLSPSQIATNSNGYFEIPLFDDLGFNSLSKIKDYNKCCNYILKYITKDCVRNEHNQIYICSRGLKKPDHYEINSLDFIDWQYENDFVKIKDFYFSDNQNSIEVLKLFQSLDYN